ACAWRARSIASRKATSCTSASTSEPAGPAAGGQEQDSDFFAKKPLTQSKVTARITGSLRGFAVFQRGKNGGIPKRPTGADCKSAGLRLRWFESTSLHHSAPRAEPGS